MSANKTVMTPMDITKLISYKINSEKGKTCPMVVWTAESPALEQFPRRFTIKHSHNERTSFEYQ